MTGRSRARGRLLLILLALVFFGPLSLAAFLYFTEHGWQPAGRTNHGELLDPIVSLAEQPAIPALNALTDGASEGRWALIYADPEECLDACRSALFRLRQSRLMLGRDVNRMTRVFLHGDISPDRVFLAAEHDGLITIQNDELSAFLDRSRPTHLAPGGLFLVDPIGNLVMYFAADLAPEDMVSDIEHLLELSRIG